MPTLATRRAALGSAAAAAGLALLVATAPRDADACSCSRPDIPQVYAGAEGSLPRDAAGIPWAFLDARDVRGLQRRVGAAATEQPFVIERRGALTFIVPDGGLTEGAQYTIALAGAGRRARPPTVTVTVEPEALVLDEVTLTLEPRRRATVGLVPVSPAGQCSDSVDASTRVARAALPAELERYRDYLLYTFIVDGQPYAPPAASLCDAGWPTTPGRSLRAPVGSELLFSTCTDELGLSAGTHTVALRIATPDGRGHTTPAQAFELDCASPPPPAAPAPVEDAPASTPAAAPPEVGPPPRAAGCRLGDRLPPWSWVTLLLAFRRRRAIGAAEDIGPTSGGRRAPAPLP